jgi:D-glycero-alpha-D-manno-heptose-7-phosphate kinase
MSVTAVRSAQVSQDGQCHLVRPESVVLVRARAPLRISFAGGGTDVSPYFEEKSGAVLSATIDRYAFATLEPSKTRSLTVRSIDYDMTVRFELGDPLVYD